MEKSLTVIGSMLIIASTMLVACNTEETTEPESKNDEVETGQNNDEDNVLAEGEFDDQLDLAIGDTGRVDTLSGAYGVTVDMSNY